MFTEIHALRVEKQQIYFNFIFADSRPLARFPLHAMRVTELGNSGVTFDQRATGSATAIGFYKDECAVPVPSDQARGAGVILRRGPAARVHAATLGEDLVRGFRTTSAEDSNDYLFFRFRRPGYFTLGRFAWSISLGLSVSAISRRS